MKKFVSIIAAAVVSCSAVCMTAYAADTAETKVYVTISDGKSGTPVLIQKDVTVTDIDNDGKLTINDALYIAHEDNYSGGAAAGYASKTGDYGLMLSKLWGIDNNGGFGYYVDNNFSMGLSDPISDGNYIYAFVYTDLASWSDTYSWFDKNTVDAKQGDELELTLSKAAFDSKGNFAPQPLEGAVITVDGEATEFKTDAEGKVKVKLDKAGSSLISAKSDSLTLVPPVLKAEVAAADTETTTSQQTTVSETTTSTTSSDTTTTTADTTTTTSSATSSGTTSATTTAKAGTSSKNDSPKTGDTGTGAAVFILGTAVCTAFALKKKHE